MFARFTFTIIIAALNSHVLEQRGQPVQGTEFPGVAQGVCKRLLRIPPLPAGYLRCFAPNAARRPDGGARRRHQSRPEEAAEAPGRDGAPAAPGGLGGHRRTHRSGLCSGARRRRAVFSKKEPPRRRRRHARVRLRRRPQARRGRVVLQRHGPGGHGRRLGPHGPDGAEPGRVRDVRLHRRPADQRRTARRVD